MGLRMNQCCAGIAEKFRKCVVKEAGDAREGNNGVCLRQLKNLLPYLSLL